MCCYWDILFHSILYFMRWKAWSRLAVPGTPCKWCRRVLMDGGVHPPKIVPKYFTYHCTAYSNVSTVRGLLVVVCLLLGYRGILCTTTYLLPVGVSSNLPACFVSLPVPWYQVRCLPLGIYVPGTISSQTWCQRVHATRVPGTATCTWLPGRHGNERTERAGCSFSDHRFTCIKAGGTTPKNCRTPKFCATPFFFK